MGLLEGLPVSLIVSAISILGLPGAVLILWYVDNRRYDRQEKKRDKEMSVMLEKRDKDVAALLSAYKDDIRQAIRMYEDNVLLVKNYQKLADDLAGIITLNTQAQTQLVEQIKHNMFCPIVREKGPQPQ